MHASDEQKRGRQFDGAIHGEDFTQIGHLHKGNGSKIAKAPIFEDIKERYIWLPFLLVSGE